MILTLTMASGLLSAEEVTVASIQAAAEDCVRKAFSGTGEVVIEWAEMPALGDLEGQEVSIEPRLARSVDTRGPVLVALDFWRNDRRIGERSVSASVEVYADVLVADERLHRHAVIGPDAVRSERRDIRSLSDRFFRSVAEVVGKRSKCIIPEGDVLLGSDVEAVPVIERGEKVVVVVSLGQITVSARATALEDGAAGDVISVKNDRSGKRLSAVVVEKGVVRVEVGGFPNEGG